MCATELEGPMKELYAEMGWKCTFKKNIQLFYKILNI